MTKLPLSDRSQHVVVDMQEVFATNPQWGFAGIHAIVPAIAKLAAAKPAQTLWTRFISAHSAEQAEGSWAALYRLWPGATLEAGAQMDILPSLLPLVSGPDAVFDKPTYSAFHNPAFVTRLKQGKVDTLVLSGIETDVCVLATLLEAVDRGYFVVMPVDALTSSDPDGHRQIMDVIPRRLKSQVFIASVATILEQWS
ncbi:cysteine hydrolase family protein [Dongia mobilis]|uniref:cysteine hydrolase family protein n=1 Tax=Dongia sp. TaxID=1977262 RepID=UPI0026EE2DD9